ncbi:hypothetical protein ATANTOWER_016632 [Ataeniobius toweri]|uniref:Uncharacterized protein n=1 Tax=Ataeniobius toweri TaxID=208326 RepID=A0ABU7CK35_9TELE|nr:hypothetical protein [Ataeniobius toweri]
MMVHSISALKLEIQNYKLENSTRTPPEVRNMTWEVRCFQLPLTLKSQLAAIQCHNNTFFAPLTVMMCGLWVGPKCREGDTRSQMNKGQSNIYCSHSRTWQGNQNQ